MTDLELLAKVAKLDGVEVVETSQTITLGCGGKNYVNSRDAVIPVIAKVCNTEELQTKFNYALYDILTSDKVNTDKYGWTWVVVILATAKQLCLALVKVMEELPNK